MGYRRLRMKASPLREPIIDEPSPTELPTRHRAAVCIGVWLLLSLVGWAILGAFAYFIYKAGELIHNYAR